MDTIRVDAKGGNMEIQVFDCYDWKRELHYYEAFVVNAKEYIRRSAGTSRSKRAVINKAFDIIDTINFLKA